MSKGRRQYHEERGFYTEIKPFRPVRIFLSVVGILLLLTGIIGGIYGAVVISKANDIDPRLRLEEMRQSKSYVPLEKISPNMKTAIVAIEDKRFYSHKGIDYIRLAGAVVYDISHLSLEQGGSTLTMQLAKLWYTDYKKSFERKVLDMWYAHKIEKVMTKEEILEAYLNTAGFSQGTVGVGEASQCFFRVKAQDLDLAQAALLSGVVNRPVKYTPGVLADIIIEDRAAFLQIHLEPAKGKVVTPTEKQIYDNLLKARKISHLENERLKAGKAIVKKVIVNPQAKVRQEQILKVMLDQRAISERQYGIAVNENIVIYLKKME